MHRNLQPVNQSQQAKQGKIPFYWGTPSELSHHVILGIKCECPSWKAGHAQEALLSGSLIQLGYVHTRKDSSFAGTKTAPDGAYVHT